jgi:hypothetical protein
MGTDVETVPKQVKIWRFQMSNCIKSVLTSAGALGLLLLTVSKGVADSRELYAIQNGVIVTSVGVGSKFEIQATHVVSSSEIYLYANPGNGLVFFHPYSSQGISQALCTGNGSSQTCTWMYVNGGSPELYSGIWTFELVKVVTGPGGVRSVSLLASTTIRVNN